MKAADLLIRLTQNRLAWRITLALMFLIPVLLVLPHARSLVVRNAIITAYLGDITAPVSGKVDAIHFMAGSKISGANPLISILNDRADRSQLVHLEVLRDEAALEVERARARLESLKKLTAKRHSEFDAFVEAVAEDLKKQQQQARDQIPARQSTLKAASRSLERASQLHKNGRLSEAEVEIAQADFESAQAANSANQLELKRIGQQLDEIRQGVFQIDVPDGALLTQQMVQQLDLEVARMEHEFHLGQAQWKATQAEFAEAEQAFRRSNVADVGTPENATVWNVYVSRGSWVTEGTTLASVVDCSKLMADIAVDDATLELIEPGQKVRLRLFGTLEYLSGEVILVRGSGGLRDTPVLAAEMADRGSRKGRVLARLNDSRLQETPASSCAIGRTTYAEFEGISLPEILLYPLFR